jgi:hypothetical protein
MVLDGRLNVVILLATGTVFPAGRSKVAESSVWKIRKYKKNGRTLFLRKAENRKIDGQKRKKKIVSVVIMTGPASRPAQQPNKKKLSPVLPGNSSNVNV